MKAFRALALCFASVCLVAAGDAQSLDPETKNRKLEIIKEIDEVVKSGKARLPDFLDRAAAYRVLGKYEEAATDYTAAIASNPPGPAFIYDDRAKVYIKMKKYDLALKDADYLLWKEPENPEWSLLRGTIYSEQKDFPRATADLDLALEKEIKKNGQYMPGYMNDAILIRRADVYFQTGKAELAFKELAQVIANSKGMGGSEAMILRAKLHCKNGNKTAAALDETWLIKNGWEIEPCK